MGGFFGAERKELWEQRVAGALIIREDRMLREYQLEDDVGWYFRLCSEAS